MLILESLLLHTDCTLVRGTLHQSISTIQFDSRKVTPQSLFVAISGTQTDGHQYIASAIGLGASVIVCETLPEDLIENITYLLTPNSAKTLGIIASNFYGNPSQKLKIVAITGTNGKTTTATLLFKLFRKLGYSVGLFSTVQNQINEDVLTAKLTTPDPLELQSVMAEMLKRGCTHAFMEASSHALVQERMAGVDLDGAVFANITHDHLDFHQTFDNYIKAKKKLFDELPKTAFALVNSDDKRGRVMLQNCHAKTQKTFALQSVADFKAKLLENTLQGLLLELDNKEIWFRLIGDFNAYNLLSVYSTAVLLGEEEDAVLTELSGLTGAPGRFEQVPSAQGITGIIDYAHTPDALKNVLETIEQLKQAGQRIITVVGCGGDRDKTKRPVMARIACEFSDTVILTSDNPRTEDPTAILQDMWAGLNITERKKAQQIENRKEAIQTACRIAQTGDIVLVAGKGHENYQEIKGIRYPCDDKEILKEVLA
jgi:UDP-N-acetylmuramoyl-L-alanyl-D-glutamate--2,6-diaminopimelate ligase